MSSAGLVGTALVGLVLGIGLGLGAGFIGLTPDFLDPEKVELQSALERAMVREDGFENEILDLQENLRLNEEVVSRLQSHINEIQANIGIPIEEFEAEVDRLQAQIASLNSERNSMDAQIASLTFQLEQLRQASFDGQFQSIRIPNFFGADRHDITGTLVNYGTSMGTNVNIIFRWFNGAQLVSSSTLSIGSVPGRSVVRVDTSHIFDEAANRFSWEITF